MPPLKKGHRYRVRVNSSAHVGNGCGYGIYVNGKLLIEQPRCIGRGGGEKPNGAYVTKDFLQDFDGREVTIAVKTFLRFNDKYKVKPSTQDQLAFRGDEAAADGRRPGAQVGDGGSHALVRMAGGAVLG